MSSSWIATHITPTQALKPPKKTASASLLTSSRCAIARNCQLAIAVTNDESTTIVAIARRWPEPSTSRRLVRRPSRPPAPAPEAWRSAGGRLRQSAPTTGIATSSSAAVASSRLSAPKRRASPLETKPPAVAPSVAPAPTKPKSRRASRGVTT